jgi:hypothetical protein
MGEGQGEGDQDREIPSFVFMVKGALQMHEYSSEVQVKVLYLGSR